MFASARCILFSYIKIILILFLKDTNRYSINLLKWDFIVFYFIFFKNYMKYIFLVVHKKLILLLVVHTMKTLMKIKTKRLILGAELGVHGPLVFVFVFFKLYIYIYQINSYNVKTNIFRKKIFVKFYCLAL